MIMRPMENAPYVAQALQEPPRPRNADPLGAAGHALARAFRWVRGRVRR